MSMYHDDAAGLLGSLRLLDSEICQYARMHLEELVPRGTVLTFPDDPVLVLWSVEWVTCRFVHIRVTQLFWNEEEPGGTIEDFMLRGEAVWIGATPGPCDADGHVTHALVDLRAESLCNLLAAVERLVPLTAIGQRVPAGSWADLTPLATPLRLAPRRADPFSYPITAIGWSSAQDATNAPELVARVRVPNSEAETELVRLADEDHFPHWLLGAVDDALAELGHVPHGQGCD
jgi:hypothetical protein